MPHPLLVRFVALLATSSLSFASIRLYVDATAAPGGNGYTWGTAMNRLEVALDYAATHSGTGAVSEIWVAQGSYVPTTVLDPNKSFLMVAGASMYGGFAGGETTLGERDPVLHPTILTGDFYGDDGPNFANRGDNMKLVVFATGVGILNSTVLDGFSIVGGNSPSGAGGGLRVQGAAPDVRNCTFEGNRAPGAAGASASFGSGPNVPRFTNCRFVGNWSTGSGPGGLGVENMTSVHVPVIDCLFESNIAPSGSAGGLAAAYADVLRCTFRGNSAAQQGGGMVLATEGLALDCVFVGNSCGSNGGGVWNTGDGYTGAPLGDRVSFVNCLFAGNTGYRGGALYVDQGHGTGPTILDCTFAGNNAISEGGGLSVDSNVAAPYTTSPNVRNSIFWGNADPTGSGELAQIRLSGLVFLTIENCDVQGWTGTLGGITNFGLDPQFMDPNGCDNLPKTADDDYRLAPTSPCRNAGDNYALPTDVSDQDGDGIVAEPLPLDFDGIARLSGALVDLGPYESYGVYPASFCFGDGIGGATGCPCGNQGAVCHGCANSENNLGATLASSGAVLVDPDSGLETLQLHAAGMPPVAMAVYLQGSTNVNPGVPFGDGVRCTGGNLLRLAVKPSSAGASQFPAHGDVAISESSAAHGDIVLGSGLVRFYQTYYRDPAPTFCAAPQGDSWNVTNGISVQW